jgi:nucleoside-diphosphate-sugar epimerase
MRISTVPMGWGSHLETRRNMRILIIGGTRFIGPRVVRRLARDDHQVGVFYRGEHEASLPTSVVRFKHPEAHIPVTNIPSELQAYSPDVVLHMIAMGERDAETARDAFVGIARRLVVLSSGDVYRAYGIFKGTEEGELEPVPLAESAPLRSRLYPYRRSDTPHGALEYYYDKILVERTIAADARLPTTVLRLPKVYGAADNADLATVYGFRAHPHWRWTHGFVDNVAQAIVLAIECELASGRIYNVGEETTPTIAERLQYLPENPDAPRFDQVGNFSQDIVYDTSAIRSELGYREEIPEKDAMRNLCRKSLCR